MTCKIRVLTETRNSSTSSTAIQIDGLWIMESLKVIDFANSADKKWLMNHMMWAFHNDRKVTATPESN